MGTIVTGDEEAFEQGFSGMSRERCLDSSINQYDTGGFRSSNANKVDKLISEIEALFYPQSGSGIISVTEKEINTLGFPVAEEDVVISEIEEPGASETNPIELDSDDDDFDETATLMEAPVTTLSSMYEYDTSPLRNKKAKNEFNVAEILDDIEAFHENLARKFNVFDYQLNCFEEQNKHDSERLKELAEKTHIITNKITRLNHDASDMKREFVNILIERSEENGLISADLLPQAVDLRLTKLTEEDKIIIDKLVKGTSPEVGDQNILFALFSIPLAITLLITAYIYHEITSYFKRLKLISKS
ncbi:uncharacterized protein PRCAT00000852001 [Priceomyces carsonii]|uniref:uncharacterized protein n=1 Tax=Priceomyces carsonii TaxID=28549 RepID=UPI002EDADE21|nr:unnamed protein product [Priceomyces carsonii]